MNIAKGNRLNNTMLIGKITDIVKLLFKIIKDNIPNFIDFLILFGVLNFIAISLFAKFNINHIDITI